MFDIGWSELLIFVVVTLIFVGPKELPVMMRTVGRYVGMLRRQAEEFRGHFDAAIEEAELDTVQSELNSVGEGVKQSLDDGVAQLNKDISVQEGAPRATTGNGTTEPASEEAAPQEPRAEEQAVQEPAIPETQEEPLSVAPTKADAS